MNLQATKTASILNLQEVLASSDGNMVDIPEATHVFAPGAYARRLVLPKGCIVVGKMHRHSHINVISYGKVRVATYEGVDELQGPHVFASPPNVKRAVYAEEETFWTTIHITNETDLAKIEDDVIIEDGSEEFLSAMNKFIGGES